MRRFADQTFRQIAEVEKALLGWPDHISFHADAEDSWVHVTHGSMAGHRSGISTRVTDADLRDRLPEDISLFVGAHTHKPLQRQLGRTRILNVGSVGSPFDDDVRACYGQLEFRGGQRQTRIVRLPYDRARTRRNFMESSFIEQGGPLARIIFEEWRQARILLARWHHHYGARYARARSVSNVR